MGGKWWLWYLLIFFFAAPAFSQDTIYLDKKGRWLDSKENAFRYCTRVDLAEDNIEVKVYNLGDTLLYLHHFSYFVDDPKKCIVNGVSSIFYADGQLSDTYMNVKGKKEGEYRRFYRNGELKYLCHFENNRREGQLEMYYPNGSLWRTEEFRKGRSQGGHVYNAAGNEIEFYPQGGHYGQYTVSRPQGGRGMGRKERHPDGQQRGGPDALPACYPAADVYDAVPNVEADEIRGRT